MTKELEELPKENIKKEIDKEQFNRILEKVKAISQRRKDDEEFEQESEEQTDEINNFVEGNLSSSSSRIEDLSLQSGMSQQGQPNLEKSLEGVRVNGEEKEEEKEKSKVYENIYEAREKLYSERDDRNPEVGVRARLGNAAEIENIRLPGAGIESPRRNVGMTRIEGMSNFNEDDAHGRKYEVGNRLDFTDANPLDQGADDRLRKGKKYFPRA